MPHAELTDDGRIALFNTTFADTNMIKMVPGSRFDPDNKRWHYPLAWATCLALRGVFGQALMIGPQLNAWAYNERVTRIEPSLQLRQAIDAPGAEYLYPFQRAGVQFLVTAKQALLADEMGLGKTVQTITAVRQLGYDAFPVVVICPNTIKLTWKDEWNHWDPSAEVVVIGGSAVKRRNAFIEAHKLIDAGRDVVVVINWEAVRGHSRLAPYGNVRLSEKERKLQELNGLPTKTVIVDEAHRMKDARTKQTRATWAVQHGKSVVYRFSLTGTPIANHPGDLWSIMHGVTPLDYPSKTTFVDRYCLQSWSPFGGIDIVGVQPLTRDEFYAILDPRMRRMPKSYVLSSLPPKVRQTRHVELSPKALKAYRELESSMITRLDDGSVLMTTNHLAMNTRLIQFSSAYAIINEDGNVRLSEPSPKLDALEEILDELGDDPVVVAAESRQLIELAQARMEKRGTTYRMIVGGMADEQRKQSIDDFQSGRVRVMLMTLKAGGVGITLSKASVIIFLQRSWSMIDNKQGEDRVHRIGSEAHDRVLIIDMVAQGTVEEDQIPKLHEKFNRLQQITRDIEVARANGDMEAVARLEQENAVIEYTPLWPNPTAYITDEEGTDAA